MIRKPSIFLVTAYLCLLSFLTAGVVHADSHHETGYVSWGTDEFELFGLTRPELTKQFKGVLEFDKNYETAWLNQSHNGPQFIVNFSNGKVASVQRMFIDGAGCRIMGPVLDSKKAAAKFSVEGLTERSKLSSEDQGKLAQAKKALIDAASNAH